MINGIDKQIIAIEHKRTSLKSRKSIIALFISKVRKKILVKVVTIELFGIKAIRPPTIAPGRNNII